jgi:molybdopterin-containing oxidoreductase family iron-sulfur binding subunit
MPPVSRTTDITATVTHEETMAAGPAEPVKLSEVRAQLASKRGPEYWRALEEFAETDAFADIMHREFPRGASELQSGIERRSFLKCMGASIALAGVTASCSRQPDEHIVPFVKPSVEMQPGSPVFFATAMPQYGYAIGLLAENHTGRPVKLEGNPNHPASLGATDIFAQASILSLYDPDRSSVALNKGAITTWENFVAKLDEHINGKKDETGKKVGSGLIDAGGAGIRLLTGTVTSPTLASQIKAFQTAFPQARWHQFEPVNRDNANGGARMAFGEALASQLKFELADVIVSLDANFLEDGPGSVRYSREFSTRRDAENNNVMNRLYAIESTPTLTGAAADHFLHVRPSQVETFARAIARKLGLDAPGLEIDAKHAALVDEIAADLQAHKGASIVVAGDSQPAIVHAIVHAINETLGNAGKTVIYTDPIEADAFDQLESLRTLVRDMEAGTVDTLIIVGVNPVYDAPVDLKFTDALQKVPVRIHMGLYQDETSDLCHWHLPEAHYLESWGDCRAYDGTVALIQPLIHPMYGGKTAIELVAALFGKGGSSYDLVRKFWQNERGTEGFEPFWRESLAKGVVADSAFQPKQVPVAAGVTAKPQAPAQASGLELSFRPDPTIGDGRWTNNGWLQELPKPLTKLTWDNAVIVSYNTASKLGVELFDEVEVKSGNRSVRGQVWIQPGHPDDVATLHLGYGRMRAGHVGDGTGFNAYAVRTSEGLWFSGGASISRIGGGAEFSRTELHQVMTEEHRPIARMGTLDQFKNHPESIHDLPHALVPTDSIFPPYPYEGYAWAMAIDMNKCTGCGVCAIACQSENNIPVVGKEQVIAGRQMHWIRVDRYYKGDPNGEVQVVHQPVPCMQCENAPCEVVCPVAATMHSQEGLNDMVYNRCVGTRYCSNNCPYKVRRFNFLHFSDQKTPTLQMMYNPDVTVRTRGVMEKCTYCVQRINLARIDAKKENRDVRDGEIITACQQACPAGAIVFGNQRDPESRVSKLKASKRNYSLLADLNTRPRTTYLAKLRNPNPKLEAPVEVEHGGHH